MNLPLTHVTPWENFRKIAIDEFLLPKPCRFFKEELIYLNFGRLAYKPSKKDYNWNENSPVIIFFNNRLLDKCNRYFPFDTGAILAGRFRATNLNSKKLKEKFAFDLKKSTPENWINSIYSSNLEYIEHKMPSLITNNNEINHLLIEAYNQLEKNDELDYRLTSIECHSKVPISIKNSFLVIIPNDKKDEFSKLKISSALNVSFYSDLSQNGYLPHDLSTKANKIFTQLS
ncbi:hypothetical protein [uncultured Dokdonia sp.]|uniref:hypothetical protein n=1 Tax=uncultured Dokdonia sp. TaxID=575653 RepID=UPI00261E6B84|nr:hypothetical protein [uncultured Dokdonia sp.]